MGRWYEQAQSYREAPKRVHPIGDRRSPHGFDNLAGTPDMGVSTLKREVTLDCAP